MNRLDEPAALNREALLDAIYQIQADLHILAEQLARERHPVIPDWTMMNLAYMHRIMTEGQPSLRRH